MLLYASKLNTERVKLWMFCRAYKSLQVHKLIGLLLLCSWQAGTCFGAENLVHDSVELLCDLYLPLT